MRDFRMGSLRVSFCIFLFTAALNRIMHRIRVNVAWYKREMTWSEGEVENIRHSGVWISIALIKNALRQKKIVYLP